MNYHYTIQSNLKNVSHPWLVNICHENGDIKTFCKCTTKAIAEQCAKRYNAIRAYSILSGEERVALMIMLDVESADSKLAFDTCLQYIEGQKAVSG